MLNSVSRSYYGTVIIIHSLLLPIIVYITRERWLVHTVVACALMLGNVILSVPVHVRDYLLRILGNGDAQMYPLGRFPTSGMSHCWISVGYDLVFSSMVDMSLK